MKELGCDDGSCAFSLDGHMVQATSNIVGRSADFLAVCDTHDRPPSWYSIEVVAKAASCTCLKKSGLVQQVLLPQALHANPTAIKASLGLVTLDQSSEISLQK